VRIPSTACPSPLPGQMYSPRNASGPRFGGNSDMRRVVGYLVPQRSRTTKMGQGENGPAFSRTALISAENMTYSSHLDARDQSPQAFCKVRLMGRMGSHPASPTNLGGVGRLTGAAGRRERRRESRPGFAGSCLCPVLRVGYVPFHRDHSSACETGFSLPNVISGGFSGERASESG